MIGWFFWLCTFSFVWSSSFWPSSVLLQLFHTETSQPQDVLVSSLPICSSSQPTHNRLRWPLWEFCDVFNADLSHHVFSSFQAFYDHSSKSTFITFCLWLPSFQNWLAAAVLPLSFFSSRVLYVSTLANDLCATIPCHCAPCFPVDGKSNVINDLPLLKLRFALFAKIMPVLSLLL